MNYREINARIAESVLNTATPRMVEHPSFQYERWHLYNVEMGRLNDYTKFENVEPIIKWLTNRYKFIEMGNSKKGWWVNVPRWSEIVDGEVVTHWGILATEESLAMAVCVSALVAVGLWEESLRNDS